MPDITINNTTLSFNEIIYVDAVNGNDTTGDGTENNPVKTIQKAQTLISVDNTAILLAEGEYNEVVVNSPASANSREYALFISRPYSYSVLSLNPTSTFINVTFNRNYCFLISQTNAKEINLYNLNINIDIQYNFSSQTTIISDGGNYSSLVRKFRSYNCVYNYVGVPSYQRGLVYINSPVDWEFDNCIFLFNSNNSNTGHRNNTTAAVFKNCVFDSVARWTGWYNGSTAYSPYLVLTNCIESNSASSYINVTRNNPIVEDVSFDENYNITNTDVWVDAGTGLDPDGSQADIGVYGGPFAWPPLVVVVEAYLNINETYNQLVNVSGTVTHKEGTNTRYRLVINGVGQSWTNFLSVPITIDASVNPLVLNYGDNVIVVEAEDIDGKISSSGPLNITRIVTELIQPQEVYANKVNIKWLPILSPSLLDMDVSLVRAGNGLKKFNINTQDTNYEDTTISMNSKYSYMLADAKGYAQVSCGYDHCTALKSDGSLVSWGRDDFSQVSNTPTGTDFVQVSCGYNHCTALKSDGSLVSWGRDDYNQVSNTPTGTDFVQVSCGYYHCTALKSDGSLVSWGLDDRRQVSDTPTGTDFVQVSCGHGHCTALKSDGSLVSWGYNNYGQVSDTPTGTDFVQVSCGVAHCTALKSDGSLVSWGYNSRGQVSNTPTGTDFVQVSCGQYHCTALKSDGSLVSWGYNNNDQVSNTPTDKNIQISQNVISIITPSSFGYVYKWIDGEYVLKVIEGIAFDDATVDHNFYSVPPNIILRPLNLGDLIGNKMSDVFKFEVINTYEEKNLTVTLYAVDQNDNKALQVSTYGEFQDSETPEFRSRIMFDYDEAFSSGGFYPAVFELNAGAKKVIYCKFKPGIDLGIGEKIMHIVATTGSW